MEISIVIPVYNEEQALPKLYNSLKKVLESLQKKYEIILVDDGSTDRTWEVLSVLRAKDDSLKIIRFTRNFGQTAAIAAGFYHAQGEVIIAMDADLQNDPVDIPYFLSKIEEVMIWSVAGARTVKIV